LGEKKKKEKKGTGFEQAGKQGGQKVIVSRLHGEKKNQDGEGGGRIVTEKKGTGKSEEAGSDEVRKSSGKRGRGGGV